MIAITHACKLPSAANMREHHMVRARRVRSQRQTARMLVQSALVATPVALPVVVTLTRVSRRRLDDDNLQHAFKAWRDGIADALGVRDDDPRVSWQYGQSIGAPAVEVAIRGASTDPDWNAIRCLAGGSL